MGDSILQSRHASLNRQRAALLIALACGIALWLSLPLGLAGEHERCPLWRWIVAFACGVAGGVLGRSSTLQEQIHQFNRQSPRARFSIACAIAMLSSFYFVFTALNQDRDFFPITHDECSYAIQTQMLAHGRLWMPQHPLADFFDSFYLIVRPVYASMYFPGTALLNIPAVWLHLPYCVIPIIVSGAIVGLLYRIVAEIVHPAGGLFVAFLVVSLSWYRLQSIMLMSQLPELLFGLLMIWACLRWQRSERHQTAWLLLIGIFAGWAAITRPIDSLCFILPVTFTIAIRLHRRPFQLARAFANLAISVCPFLILQLICNHGITGHWFQTPFNLYAEQYLPNTTYGFHPLDPNARVQSVIPQKILEYQQWAMPYIKRHQISEIPSDWWNWRLPALASATLPARPLLILLPVGLLALSSAKRWLLFASAPIFLLLYVPYTFFLEHYALVIVPAIVLLLLLAIEQTKRLWPAMPWLAAIVACTVIGFAATDFWELNHWDNAHAVNDVPFKSDLLRNLHELSAPNTIVLFRMGPGPIDTAAISAEPVYNIDTPWLDNQPMIRAHDLGARDIELFQYYAKVAPTRSVSIFDRKTGKVQDLGPVGELANPPPK